MKSNTARRIDDTDDPRLPHPMFPRSDGQPESRRIFYIRLFRKRTPDGPIEFCPVRFLASESRAEGWTHFVKRFGGGYYRAEATSSANKKQAYTGGSSLRWFHFAGTPKPFPLPGSTVQAAPEPSPPAMPSATWNELRALLKSERRFFAEQLEAERKAGDERMRAWMEHAEKMSQAESARMLAMEKTLRDEREHGKQLEARLIEALKERHHLARVREVEARQAATRVTETMRIHAENEAMRIAYEEWKPVKIPRPPKPRSPKVSAKVQVRSVGRPRKLKPENSGAHDVPGSSPAQQAYEDKQAKSLSGARGYLACHPTKLSSMGEKFCVRDMEDMSEARSEHGSDAADVVQSMLIAGGAETPTNVDAAREAAEQTPRATREATPPTQEAPSIRLQRTPPLNDPKGMTTIRTFGGWVTIPSNWLEPDASAADIAALGRVLDLGCKVSPLR